METLNSWRKQEPTATGEPEGPSQRSPTVTGAPEGPEGPDVAGEKWSALLREISGKVAGDRVGVTGTGRMVLNAIITELMPG